MLREIKLDALTIMGGPSFPIDFPSQGKFMKEHPEIDFYVPVDGEEGFSNIIECAKGNSSFSKFISFDIEEIVMTRFDYSNIQNRYYIINTMNDMYQAFKDNQNLFWFEG